MKNTIVRSNRITHTPPLARRAETSAPIMLTNTDAVRLENNTIKEPTR